MWSFCLKSWLHAFGRLSLCLIFDLTVLHLFCCLFWNLLSVYFERCITVYWRTGEKCVWAGACVCQRLCVYAEQWKEENLIITVIKAIIRKKTTLTQKCLSWKASQLNLLQPIKRVITIHRAPAHSCMTEFAHLRNQTHAKHEAVRKNTMLTDIAFTHLFTTWITNTQHESIWVTNKGTHIMQHACT